MNVSFKTIRRSGDKVYILSEISDYDERLPVVLSASTETGALIPSDTFPYCDINDTYALREVLYDGALANQGMPLPPLHTKNSAGVRFFVISLPWLEVKRWDLVFRAIDASGTVVASCRKSLDALTTSLKALASQKTSPERGEMIEDLDGRFVHDRIHVSFVRAIETQEGYRVSALLEMPYHDETYIEYDFLDSHGNSLAVDYCVVEDSIAQPAEYGSLRRRYMVLSFLVDKENPHLCLCATDTKGTISPGFAMLGARTLEELLSRFHEHATSAFDDPSYHKWFIENHRADVPALLEQVAIRFPYEPLFSIVCLLADDPDHHIYDFVNSVAQQSYGHWELIMVDMLGTKGRVSDLKELLDDDRFYVIDADPSLGLDENFAAGLAAAEGDFMVFTHQVSDVLAPDALFEFVRAINEHPDCDFLYSDVDTCDAQGIHSQPLFRPDFSPEFLRSYNYIRDLVVMRESLYEEISPLTFSMFSAGGYELVLRATEKARRVCHVPRILCHRRYATVEAPDAMLSRMAQETGRKALVAHCQRVGLKAEVLNDDIPGHYRVRHVLVDHPLVTIVVSYEGGDPSVLRTCIRSLYDKITYDNFEVVVVDAGDHTPEDKTCFEDLEESFDTFSVLNWDQPINRSKIANYSARHTKGDFLLFVNSDARVLTDDALEVLLGYFQSPDVGIVGPKQLFVDGTIEHAGIIVGGSRVVTPLFRYLPSTWHGYLDRAKVAQNVSAVTGECMMVRREAYEKAQGFSEELALFYADVDFCLKVRDAGYLTVYTPYVELTHLKSSSRLRIHSKELRMKRRREMAYLQAAWPCDFVEGDAFCNPNLDHDSSYFALKHTKR